MAQLNRHIQTFQHILNWELSLGSTSAGCIYMYTVLLSTTLHFDYRMLHHTCATRVHVEGGNKWTMYTKWWQNTICLLAHAQLERFNQHWWRSGVAIKYSSSKKVKRKGNLTCHIYSCLSSSQSKQRSNVSDFPLQLLLHSVYVSIDVKGVLKLERWTSLALLMANSLQQHPLPLWSGELWPNIKTTGWQKRGLLGGVGAKRRRKRSLWHEVRGVLLVFLCVKLDPSVQVG